MASDAAPGERTIDTVVKMAAVADFRIGAGMLGWRVAGSGRGHIMAALTDTGALGIFVLSHAAGVAEKDAAGKTGFCRDVSPDQGHIGSLASGRVIRVILHMGAMAITALDVLPNQVMTLFTGVAVGAEIQLVRLSAGNRRAALAGAQQKTITAAQVCKICSAINGTAARIGKMNPVAGGTDKIPARDHQAVVQIRSGVGGV